MNAIRNMLLLGASTLWLPGTVLAQTQAAPAQTTPSQATTAPATSGSSAAPTSTTATPAASLSPGAKVLDTAGGTAGTIESVQGDNIVLATGRSKVSLSKASFAMGPNGPVIAMTAAQLDAAAAQAAPAAAAATTTAKANVVQGAAVSDTQGGSVGTVTGVDGHIATVTLKTGSKVRLPDTAFAAGAIGGLTVAMTAAQLRAAAGAATK